MIDAEDLAGETIEEDITTTVVEEITETEEGIEVTEEVVVEIEETAETADLEDSTEDEIEE